MWSARVENGTLPMEGGGRAVYLQGVLWCGEAARHTGLEATVACFVLPLQGTPLTE